MATRHSKSIDLNVILVILDHLHRSDDPSLNVSQDAMSHRASLIWNQLEEEVGNPTSIDILNAVDEILSSMSYHANENPYIADLLQAIKRHRDHMSSFWSKRYDCILYNTITEIIVYAICGIGIIANTVAFNIFRKMGHKNSCTILLRALAIMDSLFLIFSLLTVKTRAKSYFTFSQMYLSPVRNAFQIFAVWTSVLLGVNRYIVVCRPFMASRWCAISATKKQLAAMMVLIVILVFPTFFEINSIQDLDGGPHDKLFEITRKPWAENYYYHIIYRQALFMIVLFIAPLLLQLMFSIRLGAALNAARRVRQEMTGNIDNGDKYVTRLVLGVLVVFITCYIPMAVQNVLLMIHGKVSVSCGHALFYYRAIAEIFVKINSAVNCLLYIICNPNFRKALKNIIPCRNSNGRTWNSYECSFSDVRNSQYCCYCYYFWHCYRHYCRYLHLYCKHQYHYYTYWFLAVSNYKFISFDSVNTLRTGQHGSHFADDTFKRIFLNENVLISIKIPLKFVPQGPINNIPALVQIMAWRRPGDKPLS